MISKAVAVLALGIAALVVSAGPTSAASPTGHVTRAQAVALIRKTFPALLQWSAPSNPVPPGMKVTGQHQMWRILRSKAHPARRGVVSLGVFGYSNPATGKFTPANNLLQHAPGGYFRQQSNPFLLLMPRYADGWFRFGTDRDAATSAVDYRLIGARPVRGFAATPIHMLYPNALVNSDGVTADLLGVYDGRASYSDYIIARKLTPTMRFDYELRMDDGITGTINALGGIDFTNAHGDTIVRVAPPTVTDGSATHSSVPAGFELDGTHLSLVIHTDSSTVAPVLIDPEWEMQPGGLEYRCVATVDNCDAGAAADAPPNGYTSILDVPNIPFGIRVTKFDCAPPDDGQVDAHGNPIVPQNAANADRVDGDPKSKEVCTNAFAYPQESPYNSNYAASKRWSVVDRVRGPESVGVDHATWNSVGLTWCSGHVSEGTEAGLILSGVDDPHSSINPEGKWITGAHWTSVDGACPGFPGSGTDPRVNGVTGCGGLACNTTRYNNRVKFNAVTDDGNGQHHREDLYSGLFSAAPNDISTVQESRIAIVERIWNDLDNAHSENLSLVALPGGRAATNDCQKAIFKDPDTTYAPVKSSGDWWSNVSTPDVHVRLTDNLSGVHDLDSSLSADAGAITPISWFDYTDCSRDTANDGSPWEAHQVDFIKRAPVLDDGVYNMKMLTRDWANWSGRDNANNPFARDGEGAQSSGSGQFLVDTHAPAIKSLSLSETTPPGATVRFALSWPSMGDYPGGDLRYLISTPGAPSCNPLGGFQGCEIVNAPSTSGQFDTSELQNPCAPKNYTYSVYGQDASPFNWKGAPATSSITVDHRIDPGTPMALEFIRGATGAKVRWATVPGVDPECPSITYEYQWDDNPSFSSPVTGTLSGTQTPLLPETACRPIYFRVRSLSQNGLRSTSTSVSDDGSAIWSGAGVATTDGTVDCRPNIVRADPNVGDTSVRYFNLDDMNDLAYFLDLKVRTKDPDGDADLSSPNLVDTVAEPNTAYRHSAQAMVRIRDNEVAARNDADASARIVWTFDRIDPTSNTPFGTPTGNASVTLDERGTLADRSDGVPTQRCAPGENVQLNGQYWQLDCQTLARTPLSPGYDLTLPIRPTASTPDQKYDLDGCSHDRAQPADYRYLHNAADNSSNAINPPAGDPLASDSVQQSGCARIDLGTLIVDRTPPNPPVCPDGNTWDDANHNGVVDTGECAPTPGCPNGTTWNDMNHNGIVEQGECEPTPPPGCPNGTTWNDVNGNGVVDPSECQPTPPPGCPAGQTWTDANGNGAVDPGECGTTPPPGCPSGTTWSDANNNGIVDQGECTPTPPPGCPDGTTWNDSNGNGIVDQGECEPTPPPGCPVGQTWNDANGDGAVDAGECSITPPPGCPAGTSWNDTNGNGVVDQGECQTIPPPGCPVGMTWVDANHDGIVQPSECGVTPPQQSEPQFVRGATGARARWHAVVTDQNGDPDLSGVVAYDWTANDGGAGTDCTATAPQLAGPNPQLRWVETPLCQNGGIAGAPGATDSPPGTTITFQIVTRDAAGNLSTQPNPPSVTPNPPAIATGTVDQRPLIERSPLDTTAGARPGEDRFDEYNGGTYATQPTPNGTHDHDLIVRIADPNGLADLQSQSVLDVAANASSDPTDTRATTPRDRAQVRIFVNDTDGQGPDASVRVTYTFGANPLVIITEPSDGSSDTCPPGAGTVARTTHWQMNCDRVLLAASPQQLAGTNALDLTLPLAPRDTAANNSQRDLPQSLDRFPTPDQAYDVNMEIRDRHQEADDKWLTNANAATAGNPLYPAAEQSLTQAIALDDGLLVLDRIVPAGELTYPDLDPSVTSLPTIPLRATGHDIPPSATTSPTTRAQSGLKSIEFLVTNEADNQAAPVLDWTNAPSCTPALAIPDSRWSGDTATHECQFNWVRPRVTANYWVRARITDNVGNWYITPRRLVRVIDPTGACDGFNGAMYPHLEFDGSNTVNMFTHNTTFGTATGFSSPPYGDATPTFDIPNAGSDAFHQKCNQPDWGADTDFNLTDDSTPGTPQSFSVDTPSNAPIDFANGEFDSTYIYNGEWNSVAQSRVTLTEGGIPVTATIRLHLTTNGGLDNMATGVGTLAFWVWKPGADPTRLDQAAFFAEANVPLRCKVKTDCLGPNIIALPTSP